MSELSPAMMADIRAAFAGISPGRGSAARADAAFARAIDNLAGIQRAADARYAAKLARWEKTRPQRERAEAMRQAAIARSRGRRRGSPEPALVAAALWPHEPQRLEMW